MRLRLLLVAVAASSAAAQQGGSASLTAADEGQRLELADRASAAEAHQQQQQAQPEPGGNDVPALPRLALYDTSTLQAEKDLYKRGGGGAQLAAAVVQVADRALKHGPWSVVDKTDSPPSGDKHDYLSYALYFHPDPDDPAKPYKMKDGVKAPWAILNSPESKSNDRSSWANLYRNTTALSLAAYFSDDQRYADKAADNLRTWFLNPSTRMNPNNKYAQVVGNVDKSQSWGIIDFLNLHVLLDATKVLHSVGGLSNREMDGMQEWVRSYRDFMRSADHAQKERSAKNNHQTAWGVQMLALDIFLGDTVGGDALVSEMSSNLDKQTTEDGGFPAELERSRPAHYSMYNLQLWLIFATMARHGQGVDLATAQPKLNKAVAFCGEKSTSKMPDYFKEPAARLVPLYYFANGRQAEALAPGPITSSFQPNDDYAIPMFWNLCIAP